MTTLPRYLKRYRMVLDFRHTSTSRAELPEGFSWVRWSSAAVKPHALVQHACFSAELDSQLFPRLASLVGCEELIREISRHPGFLPAATWMIQFAPSDFSDPALCGMVQGLANETHQGAIQNIGVLHEFRGLGLGRALLLKSLAGFRISGVSRVYLEVTASNVQAVELYESVGFEVVDTRYRELPMEVRGELHSVEGTRV
ncbi:MAG: GNAT family N-acetyltransferase [Planctomycetaceae bacterium]|nr:GNAT family N-acetyltransferase [Planctomycetaceae bacterium]